MMHIQWGVDYIGLLGIEFLSPINLTHKKRFTMKALLTAILALTLIPFASFAADAAKEEMMDKDGKKMEEHHKDGHHDTKDGHHHDHKDAAAK